MAQKKNSTSFKAWSMSRKLRSLIWPFTKKLGGVLVVHSFCPVGRKFEQTNFQKFKYTGSFREDVDRCISRKISIKMIIVMMKTIIMMIIIIITEHGENL